MENMVLDKGLIYYTNNKLEKLKRDGMLQELVQEQLLKSGLPITSCSLKPMDFGNNIVLPLESSITTMYEQIFAALAGSKSKYVFFCEHDVLYHPSHFDFNPTNDETFYYNTNVWRCHPRQNLCITYDELRSASGICVNRLFAIEHYKKRLDYIYEQGFDKDPDKNPNWGRKMGFEPGKKCRMGDFLTVNTEDWRSEHPNIDIRHRLTTTTPKLHIEQFVNTPTGWQNAEIDDITSWDLRGMFNV